MRNSQKSGKNSIRIRKWVVITGCDVMTWLREGFGDDFRFLFVVERCETVVDAPNNLTFVRQYMTSIHFLPVGP